VTSAARVRNHRTRSGFKRHRAEETRTPRRRYHMRDAERERERERERKEVLFWSLFFSDAALLSVCGAFSLADETVNKNRKHYPHHSKENK
jgi:hypothetical protein